jgi:hypothetical protein
MMATDGYLGVSGVAGMRATMSPPPHCCRRVAIKLKRHSVIGGATANNTMRVSLATPRPIIRCASGAAGYKGGLASYSLPLSGRNK